MYLGDEDIFDRREVPLSFDNLLDFKVSTIGLISTKYLNDKFYSK